MRVRLQKLTLTRFKGVESFTFEPNGENASIYGRNGTGKTTVADAFSWLLFDKDTQGSKDFSIKTIDKNGERLHNLEHSVDGVIDVDYDNGLPTLIKLKKTYTEKYTKRRGSREEEFSGHETAYWIHDVPKSKKEYDAFIGSLCSEELAKVLSSITYFNALPWQKRRSIVMDISGDIADAEVIAGNPELAKLPELLEGKTVSDYRLMLKDRRPAINKELEGYKGRIEEVERTKPGEAVCMAPQGESYGGLTHKLQSLQSQRAALLAGDTSEVKAKIQELRKQADDVAGEYRMAKYDAEEEQAKFRREGKKISGVLDVRMEIHKMLSVTTIPRLQKDRQELLAEWSRIIAMKPQEIVVSCPKCGEQFRQAVDEKAFNSDVAEQKKQNRAKGTAKAEEIKKAEREIIYLDAEIKQIEAEKQLADESAAAVVFPLEPDVSGILKEIEELEASIGNGGAVDTSKIDGEIEEVKRMIKLHDEAAANRAAANNADKRIVELKAEQKANGKEIDEIDANVMLCEAFTRAKVGMLESKVNEKFAPLKFKLFDQQVNGGIAEVCEVLIPSRLGAYVPYGDAASNGERILAGLKIIEILSDHYGVKMPVFVDNSESVTSESEYDFQVIRLYAHKPTKELSLSPWPEEEESGEVAA